MSADGAKMVAAGKRVILFIPRGATTAGAVKDVKDKSAIGGGLQTKSGASPRVRPVMLPSTPRASSTAPSVAAKRGSRRDLSFTSPSSWSKYSSIPIFSARHHLELDLLAPPLILLLLLL
jgi:hypothetical protein